VASIPEDFPISGLKAARIDGAHIGLSGETITDTGHTHEAG